MQKSSLCDWHFRLYAAIFTALCAGLFARADAQEPAALQVRLREAQVAREDAEQRVAELEAELARDRRQLTALRERYADLYLASQEQRRTYESLELRAAHLLGGHEDVESGQELSRAMRAIDDLQAAHREIGDGLLQFRVYLASVLDVLGSSEALRGEVMQRLSALQAAADRAAAPLSIVAGRGGGEATPGRCRVLAVDDELQVVVLDRGFTAGIRHGSRRNVVVDERVIARLRVIEVRPSISAAVVDQGRLDDIAVGASVTAGD